MALFASFVAGYGHAQNYLLETGAPTWATVEPVPMGFVNVANGNLHIEIPFVTTPQRGGRSYVAKMIYDSRIWKIVDNGSSLSWQPTNAGTQKGWRFAGTGLLTATSDTLAYDCGGAVWYEYKNYRLSDLEGTIRRFPLHYETSVSCHTAGPTTASGPAFDATGFLMSRETNEQPKEVIGPDGTTIWKRVGVAWQDPNGNFMDKDADGNVIDTLNRTVVVKTPLGSETDYTIMRSIGSPTTALFFTSSVSAITQFGVPGVAEYSGTLSGLLQRIELPVGTTYEFTYETTTGNKYGLLKTLKLPTGETITFGYINFTDAQGNKNRWLNTVSRNGGTWTFTPATCGTNCNKVTVTRPSGDETVYTFTLESAGNGAWNTLTQSYHGSAASGTLALTVQHDYDMSLTNPLNGGSAFVRRIRTITTWPGPAGNLVAKTEATHDTLTYDYRGTNYTGSRGNVQTSSEFAYGNGTTGGLVRQQVFTYLHDSNANYIPKNIVNRVTNVQTKDAAGVKKAETITTYDSTPLTSVTGITHHDDANFGTGFALRGNPTVVQSWTGSSYLSTTLNYDMTGQVRSTTDPLGNVVQMTYTDNYFTNAGGVTPPNPYSPAPPPTNGYPTQVTLPVSGTMNYGYYYASGKQTLVTDQNAGTTYFHFVDNLDRPTKTIVPAGGWAQTDYTTSTQRDYTKSLVDPDVRWDQATMSYSTRTLTRKLMSDPQGIVYGKMIYDTSMRVQSETNPYRSMSDPTYGSTSYQYDGLNRVKKTTLPDNNFTETFYGSGVGGAGGRTTQLCDPATYGLGYPTLSKDESGKKRQVWVDALGRLIEADEPDATGALTLGTCYRYDVLGNLIQVDQGVQTRAMTYDALSRLVTETTPEAGTVNYFYTTSGGALCAGDPKALCRVTDARGITTTHTYDAENRLMGKTYSNGDPAVSYFYDQTSYNGLTITNGKGRRTGMSDGSGQTAWSYNSNGQIVTERRTIAGITKSITYWYNSNGSIQSVTYPSGVNVGYLYDTAGRLWHVTCGGLWPNCFNVKFAKDATYTPHGSLASINLGSAPPSNGWKDVTATYTYNKRLQPVNMKATHTDGTVTVMDYTYSFVSGTINDGQVKSVTNNLVPGRSQTYTYDEMNRLATAQSQATSGGDCWGQSYTYDRYANMPTIAVTQCSAPILNLSIDPLSNRVANAGFSYDAAGNLLSDGSATYTWNAEGRMKTTAGVTYDYDGDGKRVKKSNGKLYWYGLNGEVLAESDLSGTVSAEYIYFNGRRIVRREPSTGNIHIYLSDRLGTARVMTNTAGTVVEEADFYPYGVERPITNDPATPDNTYKFTGHERDTESGLDHTLHRQYSSNTGRWLSADPKGGKPGNPQSWNRYTYGNNPCNLVDPDGAFVQVPERPPIPPIVNPAWWFGAPLIDEEGTPLLPTQEEIDRSVLTYKIRDHAAALTAGMTPGCAEALGASSEDDARNRMRAIDFYLSDLDILRYDVQAVGGERQYTPQQGSQYAGWYRQAGSGRETIVFNQNVNWNDPNATLVFDQTGQLVPAPLVNFLARDVGVSDPSTITPEQFMDFWILHEVSHSFGRPDSQEVNREIWNKCFGP